MALVERHATTAPALVVTVSFSPRAGEVDERVVRLLQGATVGEAILASGVAMRHPVIDTAQLPCGVWGVRCERSTRLRDRDRVELYRPLTVDPKEARRLRHKASRTPATATDSCSPPPPAPGAFPPPGSRRR